MPDPLAHLPKHLTADRWRCLRVEDLGSAVGDCQCCGKERIRFVHHVQHEQTRQVLAVGCVCAQKLLSDATGPKQRERRLLSRAGRRRRWLQRRWRSTPRGTSWLRFSGRMLVVFRVRGGDDDGRWALTVDGELLGTYDSEDAARLAAFDAADPKD